MAGLVLVVEARAVGDGDDAAAGVDGEAPAGVVREAVADRVAAVGVIGECRDAHGGAGGGALGHRVGGAVAVADRTHVELVGIAQVDGIGLGAGRAV